MFSLSSACCLTKAQEPSLFYDLLKTGRRKIGLISFAKGQVLGGMQSALSKILTLITVSISYDENNYTTGTRFQLQN